MISDSTRLDDIETFYALLDQLEEVLGGKRTLSASTSRSGWPQRGVYFFFEPGEMRRNGTGLRVVRIGTHAVSTGCRTTLWNRLSNHRGPSHGVGNHRGSIFRLHIGNAFIAESAGAIQASTWGCGSSAERAIRDLEAEHERRVSTYIGQMPLLWLAVDDEPGVQSHRAYIERNAIALLAGYDGQHPVDPSSDTWLGCHSPHEKIRKSGLWNLNYVGEPQKPVHYHPDFLTVMRQYIH